MGRILRVGVISNNASANAERVGYTNIILKSDNYSNDNGREITFDEISVPKIIKVGYVLKPDSANYETKRFYNADGRWEFCQDPVIVSEAGVGTDPVFAENAVNVADNSRTTKPEGDMFFYDIIPQQVVNGAFALGKWARNYNNFNNEYNRNKQYLNNFSAFGTFSDMTSAVQQARRFGIIHFKRGWEWESESVGSLTLPRFQTVSAFNTGPFIWGCDSPSWFRTKTRDDLRKQPDFVLMVNEKNKTMWWGHWNDTLGIYDISGAFNMNSHAEYWSRLDQYSQLRTDAVNGQFGGVIKTDLTRDEFVSKYGKFNMSAFQQFFPDDEITDVLYNARQAMYYMTDNYWWEINSSKTNPQAPLYNVKNIDFFAGTMTLGRQMREQGS